MARALRRRSLFALVTASAAGVVAAVSCSLYDASLLAPAPPLAEASLDTGRPDTGNGCALARWPGRPAIEDNAKDAIEIVDALDSFDFGVGSDGGVSPTFGFDLDGVCTCPLPEFPESCRLVSGSKPRCDLANGRDNTIAVLISSFLRTSNAFNQDLTNAELRRGAFGLLVRIRNYNGQRDDSRLEVAIFSSGGTDRVEDGGEPRVPLHDGKDRWTIDPASLVGGAAPPYIPVAVDTNAWVADGRLVATVDFPVSLGVGMGSNVIELKGSVVVGTLVADGSSFRIADGMLAGRWPVARLLTSLEVFPDPFDPSRFLCGDSPSYPSIKSLICNGQDIVGDVKQDNTGAPCDSISMGIGFTATPAVLGAVVRPPARPKPCGAQWTDDCAR